MELIHSNLCGSLSVPFANGNKYIMAPIDDFNRMCWVYLLKKKSKFFEKFKEFHVMIDKEAHTHIGTLHSNNGG